MTTINTEPRRGRKPVEERQTIALLVIHARYVSRLSYEVSRMRSVGVVRKEHHPVYDRALFALRSDWQSPTLVYTWFGLVLNALQF